MLVCKERNPDYLSAPVPHFAYTEEITYSYWYLAPHFNILPRGYLTFEGKSVPWLVSNLKPNLVFYEGLSRGEKNLICYPVSVDEQNGLHSSLFCTSPWLRIDEVIQGTAHPHRRLLHHSHWPPASILVVRTSRHVKSAGVNLAN